MKPVRWLWLLVGVAALTVASVRPLRRALAFEPTLRMLEPRPPRHPERVAARLNTAWAWAAHAEFLVPGSEAQWQAYSRAVALEPRGEALLARRACLMAPNPDHAVDAATALTTAWPDNAYGHWLRAAALARRERRDQAWAALRRGNAAPRLVSGRRAASDWRARFGGALGGGYDTDLDLPDLDALRELARKLGYAPAPGESAAANRARRLDLARCGGRLRDEADMWLPALAGVAVQAIAFAAKQAGKRAGESAQQRGERYAAEFAAALTAAGQPVDAAWVEAQAKRSWAVRAAVKSHLKQLWPLGGPLSWLLVWCCTAAVLAATALVVLLAGALQARRLPPFELTWHDLGLLLLLALVPALSTLALLMVVCCAGCWTTECFWRPHLLFLAPPLMLVAARLVYRALGGREFTRRIWPRANSALAAVLLLLALAASLPAAYADRQLLRNSRYGWECEVLRTVK